VSRHKLLVLDLDGTLLIGDGPVLDHARDIARLLDRRSTGSGTRLLGRLEAFLAGEADPRPLDAPDGYLATRSLALAAGLSDADVRAAFLAHRTRMAGGDVPFHAPDGAAALLAEVRSAVRVALVTNAPADGLPAILAALGLNDSFDHVVGEAGKPTGLPGVVDELLGAPRGSHDLRRVLSVGDIWENDLAPLAIRGAATGFIDRHASGRGSPTFRAATFEGLIPAIRAWASSAESRVNPV
jgi:phosphoglycolate phosphatase-like HAD superfamily hydrolase